MDTNMTHFDPLTHQKAGTPANFAQLLAVIRADPTLDPAKAKKLASALRSMAKALGLPLEMLPTEPVLLRPHLANLTPGQARLAAGTVRNIRGSVEASLTHVGMIVVPSHSEQTLPPAWAAMLVALRTERDRYKLVRLARYCAARFIEPDRVNDTLLDGYLTDLIYRSLLANPQRLHRDAIRAWNLSLLADPSSPRQPLLVPDNRPDDYGVPLETLTASLRAEIDAWLDWLAGTDLMSDRTADPLNAASLKTRRKQIHLFVSALIRQGVDPAALRTLADVVAPARARIGFMFFFERAGKKPSVHAAQIAGVVRAIATHTVKLGVDDLEKLKLMARRVTPKSNGMTKRNQDELRPLRDPARAKQLLTLPRAIRADVLRAGVPTRTLALRMQTAVVIELLIMVPMRIKNLVSLRIGTHILIDARGRVTLVLPDDEIKNIVGLDVPLPAESAELIRLYIDHYRPLMAGAQSDALFPGKAAGGTKGTEGMRHNIKTCIRKRCGLASHPHLFRHICAFLILDDAPGAHGQVQTLLGHKSIRTSTTYYTGMEKPRAFAHFAGVVQKLRDDALIPLPKRSRKATRPKAPKLPHGIGNGPGKGRRS